MLLLTAALQDSPEPPVDPVLGERLIEGVATSDTLWVRNGVGAVVRFDRSNGEREVLADSGVIDFVRAGAVLAALRQTDEGVSVFNLESGVALTAVQAVEEPFALLPMPDGYAVLATDRLLRWDGHDWTTVPADLPEIWGVPSVAADSYGRIYLGLNKGEWGGGLWLVEQNGNVIEIGAVDEDPCDAPLAQACQPVTAVQSDPAYPGCVLASVGLSHFMARGAVVRACGAGFDVIFEQEIPPPDDPDLLYLPSTWPIWGLATMPNGWIALSSGKLFVSTNGEVSAQDMPELMPWHGLVGAFDDPSLVILSTDVNWGMSLSGRTPLLVNVEAGSAP